MAAWVFALLAAVAILTSFLVQPEGLPRVEVCGFKAFTGLPCPGCGLTRGFCAISHGRLAEAAAFNPFSLPLYGLSLLMLAGPALVKRFPGLARPRAQRILGRSAWIFAAAFSAFGIWRMVRLWGG